MPKTVKSGSKYSGRTPKKVTRRPTKKTTAIVKSQTKLVDFEDLLTDEEDEENKPISSKTERELKFIGLVKALERRHGKVKGRQKAMWLKELDPRTHDTSVEFTSYSEYGDSNCACGHAIKYAAIITDNVTGDSVQLGMDCFSYVTNYWSTWSPHQIDNVDKLMKANKRFSLELNGESMSFKELEKFYDKMLEKEKRKEKIYKAKLKHGIISWDEVKHLTEQEKSFAKKTFDKDFMDYVRSRDDGKWMSELFSSFLNQMPARNLSGRQMYYINKAFEGYRLEKDLQKKTKGDRNKYLKEKLGNQYELLETLQKDKKLLETVQTRTAIGTKQDSYDSSKSVFDKFYGMLERGQSLSIGQIGWLQDSVDEAHVKLTGKVQYPETEEGKIVKHLAKHRDRIKEEQGKTGFDPTSYIESFISRVGGRGLSEAQYKVARRLHKKDIKNHPEDEVIEKLGIVTTTKEDEWS